VVRQLAAILSVSDRLNNCKPVNRNFFRLTGHMSSRQQSTKSDSASCETVSFCLQVDFVYLLTIHQKREIVPTREITTKLEMTFLFLVGGHGPIS